MFLPRADNVILLQYYNTLLGSSDLATVNFHEVPSTPVSASTPPGLLMDVLDRSGSSLGHGATRSPDAVKLIANRGGVSHVLCMSSVTAVALLSIAIAALSKPLLLSHSAKSPVGRTLTSAVGSRRG